MHSAAARLRLALLSLALASAAGATELTVVTYNVWHGYYRGEGIDVLRLPGEPAANRERRLEDQFELLAELRPDLVFLQEVPDPPRLAGSYAGALGFDAVHQVQDCGLRLFGLGVPANVHGGLAILARPGLALERLRAVKLSGPPLSFCADRAGFQLGEVRYGLLAAVTLDDGRRLLLVNTHLHAAARRNPELAAGLAGLLAAGRLAPRQAGEIERLLAAGEERRGEEIRRLLAAVEAERRGGGYAAVILGGDLNAAPGSPELGSLRRAGFTMAPPLATYDPPANPLARALRRVSRPELPDFGIAELAALRDRVAGAPVAIDHLLVSGLPPGALREAGLFGTAVPGGASPGPEKDTGWPRFPSDHFGLVARIQLSPAR